MASQTCLPCGAGRCFGQLDDHENGALHKKWADILKSDVEFRPPGSLREKIRPNISVGAGVLPKLTRFGYGSDHGRADAIKSPARAAATMGSTSS
jgi:hypothetical protein